jgi:hypothetical protein
MPKEARAMRIAIWILTCGLCVAWAQKDGEKRSAGAHEHGTGKLGMAFEGLKGSWEWEIPMESIIGFEYQPSTPADKKKLADALETVRTRMAEMVVLPAASGCVLTVVKADGIYKDHGDHMHSDLNASGTIVCRSAVQGEIRFAFQKHFPKVHKTTVQFLSEAVQTGAEIVDDRGTLRIGK